MGYTPVFDTVYSGTLCGKWPTLPVWLSMLPLMDWRGHIDRTHEYIAAVTGWPIDLLREGIDALCKPDPRSRSDSNEGRRLVLLDDNRDWGWFVVNHRLYRAKCNDVTQTAAQVADGRNAEKVRRYKDRHRQTPPDTVANRHSDSDSDKNQELNPKIKIRATAQPIEPSEFVEIRQTFPKRSGSQRWGDALRHYRRRLSEGEPPDKILDGIRRYRDFCVATGIERTEHVQQAATFLGENRGYLEPWTLPAKAETPMERLRRLNSGERDARTFDAESSTALAAIGSDVRG